MKINLAKNVGLMSIHVNYIEFEKTGKAMFFYCFPYRNLRKLLWTKVNKVGNKGRRDEG
jgi:hypothetical protein